MAVWTTDLSTTTPSANGCELETGYATMHHFDGFDRIESLSDFVFFLLGCFLCSL